jgi:hypothetical protein
MTACDSRSTTGRSAAVGAASANGGPHHALLIGDTEEHKTIGPNLLEAVADELVAVAPE